MKFPKIWQSIIILLSNLNKNWIYTKYVHLRIPLAPLYTNKLIFKKIMKRQDRKRGEWFLALSAHEKFHPLNPAAAPWISPCGTNTQSFEWEHLIFSFLAWASICWRERERKRNFWATATRAGSIPASRCISGAAVSNFSAKIKSTHAIREHLCELDCWNPQPSAAKAKAIVWRENSSRPKMKWPVGILLWCWH